MSVLQTMVVVTKMRFAPILTEASRAHVTLATLVMALIVMTSMSVWEMTTAQSMLSATIPRVASFARVCPDMLAMELNALM
jgi:hypothetical protein